MTDLFLKLLHMSIMAEWLVLAIIPLRLLLRNMHMPKWVLPGLWSFVWIRLILPQSLESRFSVIPDDASLDMTQFILTNRLIGTVNTTIGVVWIVGVVVMVLYSIISVLLLHRKLRTAIHLAGNIYQSEYVKSPFVFGFVSPRIYLPFHMDAQSAINIIAHERAHIKRCDHWLKTVAFLILSIYWFNPLIWVAYLSMSRDIELACDEYVVKNMTDFQRVAYSQTLLSYIVKRHSIFIFSLQFGGQNMKRRITSILHYHKTSKLTIGIIVVIFLIFGTCFLTDTPKTSSAFPSPSYQEQEQVNTSLQWIAEEILHKQIYKLNK